MTVAEPSTRQRAFEDSLDQLLAGLAYTDLRVRWAVTRARHAGLNPDDEYRGLYISDEQIDQLLQDGVGQTFWHANGHAANGQPAGRDVLARARATWTARTALSREVGCSMRLDWVARSFGLSEQEVDALLLVVAPDLDPRYERIFAYLQDDITRKRPTVDLVLNLLTDSFREKLALRRLFSADGRLVSSRLLTLVADGAAREPGLLSHFLRPATVLIDYLLGEQPVDAQLAGVATLLSVDSFERSPRVPQSLADELLASAGAQPLYAFIGSYGVGRRAAAHGLAHAQDRPLLLIDAAALSAAELDTEEGLALALRDGQLLDAVVYFSDWDPLLKDGVPPPALLDALLAYPGIVIVSGNQMWQPAGRRADHTTLRDRPIYLVSFPDADYDTRLRMWRHHVDDPDLPLDLVANNFRFTPGQIEDAVATARDLASWAGQPLADTHLFAASRAHSNQRLGALATKIRPRYGWNDIILPADTFMQLKEMVSMVRQRGIVYYQWGFDRKLALGKGLYALFAGEPGTGKTMSAEIMARELGLDLYKVDLSTLVSKYIGETEKNLDKIFTEAATSNAILFFDEADAIFGKRSEVKDSHDRYANIEISYLLQRMESYDGIVILATNLRANMDEAFTRRLHFAIEFPFPEPVDRERIWRVTFPKDTPLAETIEYHVLAERFRIAGGNIKNIILAAAFLAAEEGTSVSMAHLFHAARREYQKMGRLIEDRMFRTAPADEAALS